MKQSTMKFAAPGLLSAVLLAPGLAIIAAEQALSPASDSPLAAVKSQQRMSAAATKVLHHIVDAKFHLYYADLLLFRIGDADNAKWELEKTTGYLRAAADKVTGERRSQIEGLENQVAALTARAVCQDDNARDRHDKVMADLRRILHEI